MESVRDYLLCLKSKMCNEKRGRTYVLLNSGLFSEMTLLAKMLIVAFSRYQFFDIIDKS